MLSPTSLFCSLCSGASHTWPRDSRSEAGSTGGRLLPWVLHVCGEMFSVAFLRLAGARTDMESPASPFAGCSGTSVLQTCLAPGVGCSGHTAISLFLPAC